jgi:hypothetical protein
LAERGNVNKLTTVNVSTSTAVNPICRGFQSGGQSTCCKKALLRHHVVKKHLLQVTPPCKVMHGLG